MARRGRRRLSVVAVAGAAAAGALLAGGCGTGGLPEAGDTSRGKQLFVEKCGGCHTLAAAGTQGTIGPNLDDAFRAGRRQGFEESTIRALVDNQIKFPLSAGSSPNEAPMPANLVTGEDVDAVASYVASVAGVENPPGAAAGGGTAAGGGGGGAGGGATDGEQIFTANCGSCHILAAAGTTGTTGPNLDETKTSLPEAIRQVRNGGGGMPAFKDQLTEEQIRAVSKYVVDSSK